MDLLSTTILGQFHFLPYDLLVRATVVFGIQFHKDRLYDVKAESEFRSKAFAFVSCYVRPKLVTDINTVAKNDSKAKVRNGFTLSTNEIR